MKDNSKAARTRRQVDAADRNKEYADLSIEEKLERAKAFNPASAETARLQAQLEAEQA